MRPLAVRFWEKVDRSGDCWLWTGAVSGGYGHFKVRTGQARGAHRVAWLLTEGGYPPEGMELDHLCRTPLCVNPRHLEMVTKAENDRRGESPYAKKARATHCVNGHEFAGYNVIDRGNGLRGCRTCLNEAQRRYQARRKAAAGVIA